MKQINKEIMALLDKYEGDLKKALRENKKLEYLYALSPLRENLLEWYTFRENASLLQVGADYGALTGLFCSRVKQVTVLDACEESLDVIKVRFRENANISYSLGGLLEAGSEEYQQFDYITLIGVLDETYEAQIEAAKALLKPGGILFVAVCNSLGMKYFAGANKDTCSLTKKEMERLLPEGEFYYPMPDYRVPSSIYSERYLPKKGDLTKTLTLYDYPRYLSIDVGAYFDTVCEDGQFENFANSFLVLWKKGEQA